MSEKHTHTEFSSERGHLNLRADCEQCFALCCVAPAFSISADFPITKKAGQACPHLQADFRCGIHTCLRQQGFRGCAVYDCFGAGQKVSQVTFGGRDWRQAPQTAKQMCEVFPIMRNLHELLWYLTEALRLPSAHPLHDELSRALLETERLTHKSPGALLELDVTAHQRNVNVLLLRASELVPGGFITSACSPVVYEAERFPADYRNSVYICEPANNLVLRDKLEENGPIFKAKRVDMKSTPIFPKASGAK